MEDLVRVGEWAKGDFRAMRVRKAKRRGTSGVRREGWGGDKVTGGEGDKVMLWVGGA
jgi:hypothetical protein